MKYAFIQHHRMVWPVRIMCRVMQVSHSGFYGWMRRVPSRREQENRILKIHIRDSFYGSDRVYGSPRVWRDLQEWGHQCSENRVARLMRQSGLQARVRRRQQPQGAESTSAQTIAPNPDISPPPAPTQINVH